MKSIWFYIAISLCFYDVDAQESCQEDAKVCPNGEVVERNPAIGCEFNPCPANDEEEDDTCPTGADGFKICPNGQIVSRDPENDCEFFPCDVEDTPSPTPVMNNDTITCDEEDDYLVCDDNVTKVYRNTSNNCEYDVCELPLDESTPACDDKLGPCLICTADVLKCPDGSVLSRNHTNNCEFNECPEFIDNDFETDPFPMPRPVQDECPTDVLLCPDFTILRRKRDLDCEFDTCPNA